MFQQGQIVMVCPTGESAPAWYSRVIVDDGGEKVTIESDQYGNLPHHVYRRCLSATMRDVTTSEQRLLDEQELRHKTQ